MGTGCNELSSPEPGGCGPFNGAGRVGAPGANWGRTHAQPAMMPPVVRQPAVAKLLPAAAATAAAAAAATTERNDFVATTATEKILTKRTARTSGEHAIFNRKSRHQVGYNVLGSRSNCSQRPENHSGHLRLLCGLFNASITPWTQAHMNSLWSTGSRS